MKPENYINVVSELNDQIGEDSNREFYTKFIYETDGIYCNIKFGDEFIYDECNDESFESEYELKEFVIKQFKKYRKYIKNIKLQLDDDWESNL